MEEGKGQNVRLVPPPLPGQAAAVEVAEYVQRVTRKIREGDVAGSTVKGARMHEDRLSIHDCDS